MKVPGQDILLVPPKALYPQVPAEGFYGIIVALDRCCDYYFIDGLGSLRPFYDMSKD